VINTLRQIGLAIGVALLIAVLGSPSSPAAVLTAYQRGWIVIAAVALAGGVLGAALLTSKHRAPGVATRRATTRSAVSASDPG